MISSKDFPNPVVAVIEALDSSERRQILVELEEKGSLSYSEILQRTGLSKGTLNYHLKKLATAGMTRNFIQAENVEHYSSYYEVSEFGRNVIENLLESFRPPSRRIRYSMVSTTSLDLEISERGGWQEVQDAATASMPEMVARAR